eukprot:1871034-Amphidinium_carterae.1
MAWGFSIAYLSFCMLYVMLFFANVVEADQQSWVVMAWTSVLEDLLILPLLSFMTPVLLAMLATSGLMCIHKKSRPEVIEMIKTAEAEAACKNADPPSEENDAEQTAESSVLENADAGDAEDPSRSGQEAAGEDKADKEPPATEGGFNIILTLDDVAEERARTHVSDDDAKEAIIDV